MSQHDWFIFPTHPHLSPPDWPALSKRLIEEGILLPADAHNVAPEDLGELSSQLSIAGQGAWIPVDPAWRTTSEVVDAYRASCAHAATLALPAGLSMQDSVSCLRDQAIDFPFWPSIDARNCAWGGARHRLGEGALGFFQNQDAWASEAAALSISLLSFEGKPRVMVGENLCAPLKPGTPEPLELLEPYGNHVDFIGAAYEDPAATWTDPDTGKSFHIFDLDWSRSLGLGYRFVKIEGGGSEDFFDRFSARLAALLGQPMTVSHQHL